MTNRDKFLKEIEKYSDHSLSCIIMDCYCMNMCDYCVHENKDNLASHKCPYNCTDGIIEWLKSECDNNEYDNNR